MRVGPLDILGNGTPIVIGNRRGVVTGCEVLPAHPCGMIAVHTVELRETRRRTCGQSYKWEPLEKPLKWRGNYTALNVITSEQAAIICG